MMHAMPTMDCKGKAFVYAHQLSTPLLELVLDMKNSLPAADAEQSLEGNLIHRILAD
jgi:hypothetical protein